MDFGLLDERWVYLGLLWDICWNLDVEDRCLTTVIPVID